MQTDHSSSPTQPLPAVHIHPGDQADIPLLLEDYAGCDGELRAVLQYTYQAALLNQEHPALAKRLLQISIEEMHHLHAWADVLVQLHAEPRYWAASNNTHQGYFTTSVVSYAADLPRMMMANIIGEKKAIASYQQNIRRMRNPSIRALLQSIIAQEKLHLAFFEDTLQMLSKQKGCP